MYGWLIALALYLLVVLGAFALWFRAARADAGPRRLAKVVAVVLLVLAVLLAACTIAKALQGYGAARNAVVVEVPGVPDAGAEGSEPNPAAISCPDHVPGQPCTAEVPCAACEKDAVEPTPAGK